MRRLDVFLELETLGICNSSVCTYNRGRLCPLHAHFVLFFLLVSERTGWRKLESLHVVYIPGIQLPGTGIYIHQVPCK